MAGGGALIGALPIGIDGPGDEGIDGPGDEGALGDDDITVGAGEAGALTGVAVWATGVGVSSL